MADAYLLENGVDRYLLEDGSGVYLLEGSSAFPFLYYARQRTVLWWLCLVTPLLG